VISCGVSSKISTKLSNDSKPLEKCGATVFFTSSSVKDSDKR